MHSEFSTSLLDACLDLESAALAGYIVPRHGFIFEHSGDSMAVFDGDRRIDRVDLKDCSEQTFLEAIDAWEMARYLGAA